MKTIEFREQLPTNGQLGLTIPVQTNHRYRVIVLIEPEPAAGTEEKWPPGVFESIAGGWEGDFVEEHEGDFEQRETL